MQLSQNPIDSTRIMKDPLDYTTWASELHYFATQKFPRHKQIPSMLKQALDANNPPAIKAAAVSLARDLYQVSNSKEKYPDRINAVISILQKCLMNAESSILNRESLRITQRNMYEQLNQEREKNPLKKQAGSSSITTRFNMYIVGNGIEKFKEDAQTNEQNPLNQIRRNLTYFIEIFQEAAQEESPKVKRSFAQRFASIFA